MYNRIFLVAVVLLLLGCKKDDKDVKVITPAASGTIKAFVNGQEVNTLSDATNAQTTSVVRMEVSGTTGQEEMLSLVFPLINKAGTYDSVAVGRYMIYSGNSSPTFLTWTASTAKLTVTKYDTVEKKISGMFSFLAIPAANNPVSENKEITEGTFTDVPITQ